MINSQKWLSINFAAFFFTWGVFLPYWTGWLTTEKDLSVFHASIIMGSGMVARAVSTFVFFPFATKLLSLRRVMVWAAFMSLMIMSIYIFVDTFIPLLIITVVFSLVYPNLLPAMESSASVLIQTERIHYGKSRSFGSIGYTVGLLLIGAATAVWNEQAILWVMLIGLASMWYLHTRPAPPSLTIKPEIREVKNKKSEVKRLISSKPFVTVLVLSILLQGAHASYYNYGFIYLQDLGVNSFYIGVVLIVAVLLEILFFARADFFFIKTKISTMYLIAAGGSTLRWILIFLFPTVWVFIFSQLLHAVSFGVAHYAFIQFISKRLSQNEIPTAQGMYASLAMGLSTAILTFIGGYLYEISPGLAFLGMTLCTIPSFFIVLVTRKKLSY
ncbi:MFS transporter [Paenisporosarcina sp. OV554]|uniref:MFS transporter n=1 Tax=Paenisporosarcina sp. OV554 TaxID=2135694 RepID=UPI000D37A15A|nr:MFS transporter [Paenisporosarcina sp. OV554]PUB14502.1 PPP family 3-phenylpropionic acid transporter [Paenisporosarcina sp. OV554]